MPRMFSRAVLALLLGLPACRTVIGGNDGAAGGAGSTAAATGGVGGRRPSTAAVGGGGSGAGAGSANGGTQARGGTGGAPLGGAGRASPTGGQPGSSSGGTTGAGAGKPPCAACGDSSLACQQSPASQGSGRAASVAAKLGRSHFLVGMGNDLDNDHSKDGAYTLGVTLDLHYAYMVGLPGMGGWPDWNANGTFVNLLADSAAKNCVTPMYTMYSMAAWGDGNLAGLADNGYMTAYWSAAKLLFERISAFDKPAVVHIEPDFWAYAAQKSGQNPASMKVLIKAQAPDCADLPETLVGMGQCWIKLARTHAPKALIGFHISEWGGTASEIVAFFKAIGVSDTDLIVMDVLDRDAGCFEAAQDPNCARQGKFYWDESNQTSPNFHEHLSYAKQVSEALDKPILWWQVPFGVPSDTPGGTAGHYRDNRVHYIFNHVEEFVAAGGLGVTFGTGAGNQTDWKTDGGQFKEAVTKYFQSPVALP